MYTCIPNFGLNENSLLHKMSASNIVTKYIKISLYVTEFVEATHNIRESDIEAAIKVWLHNATHRCGGRNIDR